MLKGGSGDVIRGPKSRSSMINRSRCTGYRHRGLYGIRCQRKCWKRLTWGGGSYVLEGGSRKGGLGRTPRTTLVTGLIVLYCIVFTAFRLLAHNFLFQN